ncbi:MAG: hypothetical protein ACOYB3_12685 [Azonexus sp.]
MNPKIFKTVPCIILVLALTVPVCSRAFADPVPATASVPGDKLISSFSGFAGSTENSASLVNGLRTGASITLTDSVVAGGPPPTSTTFTSPAKPMGYGNIRIALSLAEAQLASQGITNPTATELQGALMGTTTTGPGGTTTTDGVLQMRASGMGWGKIANTSGYKLGPVISGRQTFVPTATGRSSVTTAAGISGNGVATAGGKTAAGKGVVTGAGNAATQSQSTGITTGLGHASASTGGVVTAAGGRAGSNAGGNAGGNGKGVGKP